MVYYTSASLATLSTLLVGGCKYIRLFEIVTAESVFEQWVASNELIQNSIGLVMTKISDKSYDYMVQEFFKV